MSVTPDFKFPVVQTLQSVQLPLVVTDCKLYKRRWPMLGLFVLCSMVNAGQWIQYSIITDIVMRFYGVSSFAVDFTSLVYMITYIPLIIPASWILDKMVNSINNYAKTIGLVLYLYYGIYLCYLLDTFVCII